MPRNLVVCCDGTNNEFGRENTNLIRLVQVLDRHPERQLVYYDPGVGTMPEPRFLSKPCKWLSEIMGLAFGLGLRRNVEEAYTYLMENHEPGDRVYLFGFSRGAYTVRVLAGVLHQLGLLPRGTHNLIPHALKLYDGIRHFGVTGEGQGNTEALTTRRKLRYWALCDEFRYMFARPVHPDLQNGLDPNQRHFPVEFLGIWDTVSSVGWVWNPTKFPFTARNPSIRVIRHAVSVDERRWFFRQNLMKPARPNHDLKQYWFPGVHTDVGGGYPVAEGGLWRIPFEWMLEEAERELLAIDKLRLAKVLNGPPALPNLPLQPSPPGTPVPWNDEIHNSLTWHWWPAEFIIKWSRRPDSWLPVPKMGFFRRRFIPDGESIHLSTLRRIREKGDYSPRNFSKCFLEHIRSLPTPLPETLAFKW